MILQDINKLTGLNFQTYIILVRLAQSFGHLVFFAWLKAKLGMP